MKHLFTFLLFLLGSALVVNAQSFKDLRGHTQHVYSVAFSPDGEYIYSTGLDRSILVWEAESGKPLFEFSQVPATIYSLVINKGGSLMAGGGSDGKIYVWQTDDGELIETIQTKSRVIEHLSFAPDGVHVAAGLQNGNVEVHDLRQGWQRYYELNAGTVYATGFHPDGRSVYAGGSGPGLQQWEFETGHAFEPMYGHTSTIRSFEVSPDGELLLSGDTRGGVRAWDAKTGAPRKIMQFGKETIRDISFSSDGKAFAIASANGNVALYTPNADERLRQLECGQGLWDIEFSPDGKRLITAGNAGHLRLWDVSFLQLEGPIAYDFGRGKQDFAPPLTLGKDIPESNVRYNNRFALVIGNEVYDRYQASLTPDNNVIFARADALMTSEYFSRTLGIPERNILLENDATAAQMTQAFRKLAALAKSYGPEAEIFVFYAGHGTPQSATHQASLLPVDVSATNPDEAMPLNEMFDILREGEAARTYVFLDACFSGQARGDSPMAQRGFQIKPKALQPGPRTFVLSAATDKQAAMPYRQARQGLFTYFFLKQLHESAGRSSLAETVEEVTREVGLYALLMFDKAQNPVVTSSPDLQTDWQEWRLAVSPSPVK